MILFSHALGCDEFFFQTKSQIAWLIFQVMIKEPSMSCDRVFVDSGSFSKREGRALDGHFSHGLGSQDQQWPDSFETVPQRVFLRTSEANKPGIGVASRWQVARNSCVDSPSIVSDRIQHGPPTGGWVRLGIQLGHPASLVHCYTPERMWAGSGQS